MSKIKSQKQLQACSIQASQKKKKVFHRKPEIMNSQRNFQKNRHSRNYSQLTQFRGFYSPNKIQQQQQLTPKSKIEFLKNEFKASNKISSNEIRKKNDIEKKTQQMDHACKKLEKRIFLTTKAFIAGKNMQQNCYQLPTNTKNKNNHKKQEIQGSTVSQIINDEPFALLTKQIQTLKLQIKNLRQQNENLKKNNEVLEKKLQQINNILTLMIQNNKTEQSKVNKQLQKYIKQNQDLKKMINDFEFNKQKRDYDYYMLKKQNDILMTKLWVMKQKNYAFESNQEYGFKDRGLTNTSRTNSQTIIKKKGKSESCDQQLFQLSPQRQIY